MYPSARIGLVAAETRDDGNVQAHVYRPVYPLDNIANLHEIEPLYRIRCFCLP